MSLYSRVLGLPFYDNALFVKIDSGQKQSRLLFDCGENTIQQLSLSEMQKIDHLFFSHFHLDHVAGFDHFIRANYDRSLKPIHIWGPENTIAVVFHRMNSITWNLIDGIQSHWIIHEITPQEIKTVELRAAEAFAKKHFKNKRSFTPLVVENDQFQLSVHFLNHRIFTLGFKVQEQPRLNIDKKALKESHLKEGVWLTKVKDLSLANDKKIKIGKNLFELGLLRKQLLRHKNGGCLAYLTDFIYDDDEGLKLAAWLDHCNYLYCESQYLNKDEELARQNYHLTTSLAAQLAQKSHVKQLWLIHFSKRYKEEGGFPFLQEAQKIFKAVFLPQEWITA